MVLPYDPEKFYDERKQKMNCTCRNILMLIRLLQDERPDTPGGASIHKAIHIITHLPIKIEGFRSRSAILRSWSKYKAVSHLFTAITLVGDTPNFPQNIEDVYMLLFVARDYQRFALNYRPHGRSDSLLSPADIWLVPEHMDLPIPRKTFVLASDTEIFKLLDTYKAPQPY
jgi:hypothetical protein